VCTRIHAHNLDQQGLHASHTHVLDRLPYAEQFCTHGTPCKAEATCHLLADDAPDCCLWRLLGRITVKLANAVVAVATKGPWPVTGSHGWHSSRTPLPCYDSCAFKAQRLGPGICSPRAAGPATTCMSAQYCSLPAWQGCQPAAA
jgi:hypothetical protein